MICEVSTYFYVDTCGKCGSGRLGSMGLEALCHVPWQQIVDAVDGVLGDTVDHGAEIVFRIEAVELGRTDERVDRSGPLSALIGPGEEIVLPAQGNNTQRAFGAVVVHLQPAVVDVARECAPAGEGVADRRRGLALGRQPSDGVLHPLVQLVDQRLGTGLTNLAPKLGRLAADLILDRIERGDLSQGFRRGRRGMERMDLVKLAPCVSPAGHFVNAPRPIKMVEPCVGVGLQRAGEVLQMLSWMVALTIFRIGEPHGRWGLVPGRSVISDIGP